MPKEGKRDKIKNYRYFFCFVFLVFIWNAGIPKEALSSPWNNRKKITRCTVGHVKIKYEKSGLVHELKTFL